MEPKPERSQLLNKMNISEKIKKTIFTGLVLFLVSGVSVAQDKVGTTAAAFLGIGSGTKAPSMGGSGFFAPMCSTRFFQFAPRK